MKRIPLTARKSSGSESGGNASGKEGCKLPATTTPNSHTLVPSHQAPRELARPVSMEALGAKDRDFFVGLMEQVSIASTRDGKIDGVALKMTLSFIEHMKPQDQVHAALGLQMAAVHEHAMKFLVRLGGSATESELAVYGRLVASLMRTYREQIETHQRYSSANEPGVRGQNSSVQSGGGPMMGKNSPALPDHTAPPTLALTYAKPAALPGDGEPQRERVPPARLQRDE